MTRETGDKLRNLAIIPARSGSKGIPNKNIRIFCGKPLLYYPISVAKTSGIFDKIIVDTDSRKIASIAANLGAEAPYIRPKSFATDASSVINAVLLLLKRFKADGYTPDVITLLQTTSPLREIEDIKSCFNLLNRKSVESVVTICESHPRFYHLSKKGKLILVNKESGKLINRQQMDKGYMLNGSIVYMTMTSTFLKKKSFVHEDTYAVVCPKWRSVDLDDIEDWVHAEFLYKNKKDIAREIERFK